MKDRSFILRLFGIVGAQDGSNGEITILSPSRACRLGPEKQSLDAPNPAAFSMISPHRE